MASILGVITLAIFVVFIVYLYHTSKNTELWDPTSRTWTPGWAIASWFIPLANFVIPPLVVSDTWRRTPEPAAGARRCGGNPLASTGIVWVWWVLFVIGYRREPAGYRPRHVRRRRAQDWINIRHVHLVGGIGGPADRHRPAQLARRRAADSLPVSSTRLTTAMIGGLTTGSLVCTHGARVSPNPHGRRASIGRWPIPTATGVSGRAATRSRAARFAATPTDLLLGILLATYVLIALLERSPWERLFITSVLGLIVLLTLHTSHVRARAFRFGVAIVLIIELSTFVQAIIGREGNDGTGYLMFILVLIAPLVILSRILRHDSHRHGDDPRRALRLRAARHRVRRDLRGHQRLRAARLLRAAGSEEQRRLPLLQLHHADDGGLRRPHARHRHGHVSS